MGYHTPAVDRTPVDVGGNEVEGLLAPVTEQNLLLQDVNDEVVTQVALDIAALNRHILGCREHFGPGSDDRVAAQQWAHGMDALDVFACLPHLAHGVEVGAFEGSVIGVFRGICGVIAVVWHGFVRLLGGTLRRVTGGFGFR